MTGLRVPRSRRAVLLAAVALPAAVGVALAAGPVPPLPVLPGSPVVVPPSSTASTAGLTLGPGLALDVLSTSVQDPTALDVAPDGRVVVAERQGAIKVITQVGDQTTTVEAGRLLVNATACAGCPDQSLEEGGVMGLELAADFARTGRFYAYYSVPFSAVDAVAEGFDAGDVLWRLSSFVLRPDNTVDPTSEQVLLHNPAEVGHCCHYGGDIDLLADGTLLLTVGDDTSPREEGWGPRDARPGREAFNAERTSQNTADRRGKVLRLMPDGSVPDGTVKGVAANPFVGRPGYDPYVYALGFRSNWRAAVDHKTGSVFVGNVGPDASADDPTRGPKGYDELEVIPKKGGTNHGWPRCIADNKPYVDYDYLTLASGERLSCQGMTPAAIYYPYDESDRFPVLGEGGRSAVGGVVYRATKGARALPARYRGQLFLLEYTRRAMFTVAVTPQGGLDTRTLAKVGAGLLGPADAEVGPDGAIYLAEYGGGFYLNGDSRISRIVGTSK